MIGAHMKSHKNAKPTKLAVNKSIVRQLSNIELAVVAGGLSTPFSDCRFCERQAASFAGNC
jgi:hypothetical protein